MQLILPNGLVEDHVGRKRSFGVLVVERSSGSCKIDLVEEFRTPGTCSYIGTLVYCVDGEIGEWLFVSR